MLTHQTRSLRDVGYLLIGTDHFKQKRYEDREQANKNHTTTGRKKKKRWALKGMYPEELALVKLQRDSLVFAVHVHGNEDIVWPRFALAIQLCFADQ